MTELSQEILSELKQIKFILIVLVSFIALIIYQFISFLKGVENGNGALSKKINHTRREAELKEMIAKGNALGAKFSALEWVSSHPNEPWAHWYLAKAYDQLGEHVETKQTLLHLQKISPEWNDTIEPWLESNEENLTPKGVN